MTRHIGKLKSTGSRVVVVMMQLPGDSSHCLVTEVDSLPPKYQDSLSNTVSGKDAQSSVDLHEVLNRTLFPTGGLMLPVLHQEGLITKKHIREVTMTPTNNQSIDLVDVLEATGKYNPADDVEKKKLRDEELTRRLVGESDIAEAYVDNNTTAQPETVADQAQSLLVQAKLLADDAKRLREQAYSLDPSCKPKSRTKKPADKKTTGKTAPSKTA